MQKQIIHSVRYLRQRKFFVMLPILIFPFFTFLLWSIGLIGAKDGLAQNNPQKGFNQTLPGAIPSRDSNWNKLEYYQQADKDSARYKSIQKNDPNYLLSLSGDAKPPFLDTLNPEAKEQDAKLSYDPYPGGLQTGRDPNEEKVYSKLAQLNDELNSSRHPSVASNANNSEKNDLQSSGVNTEDIDRLENMMQTMQGSDNGGDPEMQQISGMLEKILDIQHPERIKEKLKQQSQINKKQVYPVTKNDQNVSVSLLKSRQSDSVKVEQSVSNRNSFYSLGNDLKNTDDEESAISAIIPETQTLVTGATVKMKLATDIYINGILIPADEFIYGTASLTGERLAINITTIRYENNILPVSLSVFDMDGMIGIYVPGAIGRDVSKQSTEQAIQGIGLASLDPSIGAQAASAGIQAAKSLIGKKVKQIKVTVKAGYQVLLRDDNQKNQ